MCLRHRNPRTKNNRAHKTTINLKAVTIIKAKLCLLLLHKCRTGIVYVEAIILVTEDHTKDIYTYIHVYNYKL